MVRGSGDGLLGDVDWRQDGGSISPDGHQLWAYHLLRPLSPSPLGFVLVIDGKRCHTGDGGRQVGEDIHGPGKTS